MDKWEELEGGYQRFKMTPYIEEQEFKNRVEFRVVISEKPKEYCKNDMDNMLCDHGIWVLVSTAYKKRSILDILFRINFKKSRYRALKQAKKTLQQVLYEKEIPITLKIK